MVTVNPRQSTSIQKSRNRGLAMFSSFFKCFFGTGIWNVLDPSDFRAKRLGYLSRDVAGSNCITDFSASVTFRAF